MVKEKKCKIVGISVIPYTLDLVKGEIAPYMLTGNGGSVVLNQKQGIINGFDNREMRAGDICRVWSVEAILVGFSNENDFYNPDPLLTKAWIILKKEIQTYCGLGYWVMSYPGDYFDIRHMRIIKKTEFPLNLKTTEKRIIEFLNS